MKSSKILKDNWKKMQNGTERMIHLIASNIFLFNSSFEMVGEVMSIDELINSYLNQTIHSETEVRTKLVNPLFKLLGYEDNLRGEEYPIYGYDGGKPSTVKFADLIFFNDSNFNNNNTREQRKWVQEHSLLIAELKKPIEMIDVQGQAEYYSMWARVAFYVITNGVEFAIYKLENYYQDELLFKCEISQIPAFWYQIEAILKFEYVINYVKRNENQANNTIDKRYEEYCKAKKLELSFQINNSITRTISSLKTPFPILFSGNINGIQFESEPYEKIAELEESIIVLGEAGSGKSHLLKMLANQLLEFYFSNKTQTIPIILPAKLWDKSYNSLIEGIFNELNPFLSIQIDTIKNDLKQGKFVLMIDGLDETIQSIDTLLNDIKTFRKNNIKVIITCRTHRYNNELSEYIYSCQIDRLTKEQIQQYVDSMLPDISHLFFYKIGETLSKLVENPLFLTMVINIVKNSPEQRLPNNKSELYRYFIKFLLHDWPNSKGLPHKNNYEIDLYENALADYSFNTYKKHESDDQFRKSIKKLFKSQITNEQRDFLLNAGLLEPTIYGPSFYHPSFGEYFFAYYLLKLTDKNLAEFIQNNHKDGNYQEIFIFLSGLLTNTQRQNLLLDILEGNNLYLYNKCLTARFKFEYKIELDWDKNFAKNYFLQIRNSYIRIINSHFNKMKYLFFPWCNSDSDDAQENFHVSIIGSFNLDIPAISFKFNIVEKKQKVVEYNYLGNKPTVSIMTTQNTSISMPIISLSSNDGHYYYDLEMARLGIDSAREIAFDLIKKQLLSSIDKQLLLGDENLSLKCELIEKLLMNISNYADLLSIPKEIEGLSLRTYSIPEIIDRLTRYKDARFFLPNGSEKNFNFNFILFLLSTIDNKITDISEYMLPDQDIAWDQVKSDKHWVWTPYSDNQLCKRISKFFDLFQDAYRYIVETYFPTLTENLYLYRIGPIKYIATIVKNDSDSDRGSVLLDWIPVTENENNNTVVFITNKRPNIDYNKQFNIWRDQLKILGRDTSSISAGGSSVLGRYFGDNVIRDEVYQQLQHDLKGLFNN